MTAITAAPDLAGAGPRPWAWARDAAHDVSVHLRRNLVHIAREPQQLSDVTIQPVLFTLLFVYVFGSAVPIPGGYKQFAIGGLLSMNLTTSSMGTAVGVCNDLETGAVERFRTLPLWRPSILIGRTISDVAAAALCSAIVMLTGLAIGWRPGAGASVGTVVGGFLLGLLFSYALSWVLSCIGLVSKGAESAQGVGLLFLFPLAFLSNGLVPTQHMPGWIQAISNWNPVSAYTAAVRHLFHNPNPSALVHSWPMEHPLLASVLWSVAIFAVFAPLAGWLFRRRTTE